MVPWSFNHARFPLNSDNLLASLTINHTEILARINVPEMSLEQLIFQELTETSASDGRPVPWRARIPALIEFAVSSKAYINKMSGDCPLSAHRDHKESSKDAQETEE
jgi:hypothetical protein